jgi:hypothetical protein
MFETSNDTTGQVSAPSAPKSHWWSNRAFHRAALAAVAAVPVALVNGTAFIGQFAFLHQHVPWVLPGQILFAVALESVAVYLAWHAHIAKMANDSSGRIMASAYLFALVIGAMNYSHYAGPRWHPTFMAVGLALMSASSPWLWNVHSRRVSRDKLMARGLLEEKAVRLGATRWTWHPVRSMLVTWHATWIGETNPQRAIALLESARAERAARRAPAGPDRNDGAPGAPAIAGPDAPAQLPVPPRQTLVGLPGGAAVNGGASLKAGPKLAGLTVSRELVEKVKDMLAAMSDEEVGQASVRAIARELGDANQRRLAKQLIEARLASPMPSAKEIARRSRERQMITPPAAFAPGGAASVNA